MDLGDEIFEMPMAGPYMADQIVPVLDESEQDSNSNLKPMFFGPNTFCGGSWKGGKPCNQDFGATKWYGNQPPTPPKEVPKTSQTCPASTGSSSSSTLPPAMGDWKLVRRVQAGNAWHPATDRCEGTEVYNSDQVPSHSASTADVTFALNFEETVPEYDELMFATGDCKVWLITTKDAVGGPFNGEYYENAQRKILRSSEKEHPYTAIWKNDEANPDDPWISVIDHGAAIGSGMLVYGENSFDEEGLYTKVLQDHNGANVFIRKHFDAAAAEAAVAEAEPMG